MKKIFTPLILICSLFILTAGALYTAGSPGGYSGSPGDNNKTCTQCHGGTATIQNDVITSNIPQDGYIPGNTYTITVTATLTGSTKSGFELTCEDSQNNKVGTFTITNDLETKLVNNSKSVTQKSGGAIPANNTKSWSFDWTAPATGVGNITFYNALGIKTTTRFVYTSSLSIAQNTTSISEEETKKIISIFPNPTSDYINVNSTENIRNINLMDLTGKVIFNHIGNDLKLIDISNINKGLYILNITLQNDSEYSTKIFKL